MLKFSEIFEFSKEKFRKIPVLKEFEWFEWFEWFGPSPIEPFNPVVDRLPAVGEGADAPVLGTPRGDRLLRREEDADAAAPLELLQVLAVRELCAERIAEQRIATLLKSSISHLTLIFQPNDQTLEGSFSSVSMPNFARKYSLESS